MAKPDSLALIVQMIEAAEKNIQSAKHLLREVAGGGTVSKSSTNFADKASSLNVDGGGKIIEGVFDGQNMIGPDNKQYPVPANYASKSKLIEGDVLKLTIDDDGSFIYKQIGPVERKKLVGILMQDEKDDYKVIADGKTYRVLLASLTYFKAEAGDEVTIVVPEEGDAQWAAVEHVIKNGAAGQVDSGSHDGIMGQMLDSDEDEVEMSPLDNSGDDESEIEPEVAVQPEPESDSLELENSSEEMDDAEELTPAEEF